MHEVFSFYLFPPNFLKCTVPVLSKVRDLPRNMPMWEIIYQCQNNYRHCWLGRLYWLRRPPENISFDSETYLQFQSLCRSGCTEMFTCVLAEHIQFDKLTTLKDHVPSNCSAFPNLKFQFSLNRSCRSCNVTCRSANGIGCKSASNVFITIGRFMESLCPHHLSYCLDFLNS